MHLTFVRAKGTVRSFGSKIAPLLASGFRPREWMRRPCMIVVQPASAQPSGSWAGCQQQLIAQRDPAALARGWPALARRSGRLAGSIPLGQGCQPPLGAAYCRGSAGRGRAFWAGGSGQWTATTKQIRNSWKVFCPVVLVKSCDIAKSPGS